jgi:hypothetical protein
MSSRSLRPVRSVARAPAFVSVVSLVAVLSAITTPVTGATFDPRYRFLTLTTPHFSIHFHQGEAPMAERLAGIAEETWRALDRQLHGAPPHTQVVLVDQSDLANGSAFPLPYDTVVITAVWPSGSEFIGNTDDWLRVVFAHEFTHIVHLDRTGGWARPVRAVFGRIPLAFPNLFLPTWQIEGLATYDESALTGAGRVHAGDFTAVIGEAVRAHGAEPLDRVNGGLVDWPAGLGPYVYGAGFTSYLSRRFGAERLAALSDATAASLPFFGSRKYREVFGAPLGTLWREYRNAEAADVGARPTDRAIRLTHTGFIALGPRFDTACRGCPPSVLYSTRTPHELPSLYRLSLGDTTPTRLATRYLGSTVAPGPRAIYFDQQELRRETALYSDLFALDRRTGRTVALTREARLRDPDLSPDGRSLVATRDRTDRRELVVLRLPADAEASSRAPIRVLVSEAETAFDAPRWSPDGRSIAVERHRLAGWSEVVVVDAAGGTVRAIASTPGARAVTPAWRPDGRAIVAAVAPQDEPFELYEYPVEGGGPRRLTNATGGATWPDVSPDGRTIVYVGLTDQGFDLFEIPYAPAATTTALPAEGAVSAAAVPRAVGAAPARTYSPWPTLAPRWWSPVVAGDSRQLRAGAMAGGTDVLGYHAYSVSATWLLSGPAGAEAPTGGTPDWSVAYAYQRWRPILFASVSDQTSFVAGPPDASGLASIATLRAREAEAGVALPITHVRTAMTFVASVVRASDRYSLPTGPVALTRAALRGGSAIGTAHEFGYSISRERGVILGGTAEAVRDALGAAGNATAGTADLRVYLPGLRRHDVVALRAAAGAASGDPRVRRVFDLGGAQAALSPIDFGREAIGLLRGFPLDTFAGSRAAVFNADYRFVVARPERGAGTWPMFVRTVHGAVFADGGNAWTGRFDRSAIKTDAGVEVSLDLVAGYTLPITMAVGAAYGHDGSGVVPAGTTWYLRIGRAF